MWKTSSVRDSMIFIDGENLVCRYQEMEAKGSLPLANIVHRPDVYVWSTGLNLSLGGYSSVLTATYYTYAHGDAEAISEARAEIKGMRFHPENDTCYLFP